MDTGYIEFDRQRSQGVSEALETICRDMQKAKANFIGNVQHELGVDHWQGQSKDQFDRAVGLIEDALIDLTAKVRSANNVFSEMGQIIRRTDDACADGMA
jgi:uncharacterized protein YukE